MFVNVVRLEPRDDFSVPPDPELDGGFDVIPVAAFFFDPADDVSYPWHEWALQVLDWLRSDNDGVIFGLLLSENIESDMGHWHDADAPAGLPSELADLESAVRSAALGGVFDFDALPVSDAWKP